MDVQATITREDGWRRTLQVTVPAAEVDRTLATVTKRYRKEAKIPGFRPGKAPLAIVKERFAAEIRHDALENVVPRAYEAALRQLGISPISSPSLSKVKLEPGVDMTFDVDVEIRPQVDITGYRGLKLEKRVYEVTDRDVDLAIDEMRDKAATTTEVSRAARERDVVVCDLQKIYDRLNRVKKTKFENVRFDLRKDRTRPEFFEGIAGMAVGEGREIEVTYPDNESDPDLAGNTVLFRTWLKSVAQKNIPVADDAFAKSVGDFESLAHLRERVAQDLSRRADSAAVKEMGRQARRLVVEANSFEVPRGLLSEYLDGITQRLQAANPGVTKEAVRAQFEPLAVEQFRWDFAVLEIAGKENLSVSDNEVKEVQDTWPEDTRERPAEEKIRASLLENKVYEFLLATANVTEVPRVLNPRIVTPGGYGDAERL